MDVGHISQDADLVGMEIAEVLPFVLVVAGFLNASDFVVDVMEDVASLVRALYQVAKSIQHRIFQGDQN